MTIIDVTAMGREPEVVESTAWSAIPDCDTRPDSYLVRWQEIHDRQTYGRVYPNCPYIDKSYIDGSGDCHCSHPDVLFRHCGCSHAGKCPMGYSDKDDYINGVDYAEYVRRYEV